MVNLPKSKNFDYYIKIGEPTKAADWTEYFFIVVGFICMVWCLWLRNPNYLGDEILEEIKTETTEGAVQADGKDTKKDK